MKRNHRIIILAAALVLLAVAAPAATDDPEIKVIEGEIVAVDPASQAQDGQTWNEATVRTRNGEQARLRLHQTGADPLPCEVGDQVRARVMAGGPQDGAYLVRNMRNRRTRENVQVRDSAGNMIQARSRVQQRNQDGSGDGQQRQIRTRARVHEPGTCGGDCGARGGRGGGHRGGR